MLYPKPVVVCGPSGSGKSTLIRRLLAENKDKFAFTISHTTRNPRQGEQNGREYYFVSLDEMQNMIDQDLFVEYTQFSCNYYGTSRKAIHDVQSSNKRPILEVDIEGVKSLKKFEGFTPTFVFVKPPSKQKLIERLSSRGTESPDSLRRRLDRADHEIKFAEDKFSSMQFDLILVNDDLEETYGRLTRFLNLD